MLGVCCWRTLILRRVVLFEQFASRLVIGLKAEKYFLFRFVCIFC